MKRLAYIYSCLIFSIIVMVSCIIAGSSRSYINYFIDGEWIVNDNINERITFEIDGHWSYNDTIVGTFTVVPTPDDEPHWIWEKGEETIHAIIWKSSDNKEGRMDWIDYVGDCDHMKVNGIYNHENEDVILSKVIR